MSRTNNRTDCLICYESTELCKMRYFDCCNNGACKDCVTKFWSNSDMRKCLICNTRVTDNITDFESRRCCVYENDELCTGSLHIIVNRLWFCERHYSRTTEYVRKRGLEELNKTLREAVDMKTQYEREIKLLYKYIAGFILVILVGSVYVGFTLSLF